MITICSQSSNYSKITMYSRLFWCFCIAPHHRLMARPSSAPFPLFTDLPPQIRSTRKHSLSSLRKKVDTSTATPRRLVATISQFQLSKSATRTAGQPENGRQSKKRCCRRKSRARLRVTESDSPRAGRTSRHLLVQVGRREFQALKPYTDS